MKNKWLKADGKSAGLLFSLMIAVYFIVVFLGSFILGAIFDEASSAYKAINYSLSSLSLFVVILISKFSGLDFTRKVNTKGLVKGVPLAAMIFVGMFMGLGFLNGLIASAFQAIGVNVSSIEFSLASPWHFIVFTVALAILPAVSEEIFFRDLLTKGLKKINPVLMVVIVSLSFGIYHCNIIQLVYQTIYGALLCILFYITDSLLSCMLAHFMNNFAIIVCIYEKIYIDFTNPIIISIGLVVLVAFGVLAFFMIKKKKQQVEPCEQSKSDKKDVKDYLIYGSIGLVICLATMISALFV